MDKTQKDLDLYFLTRNVQWRYRLDQYEDATIAEMLKTVRAAVADVQLQLFNGDAVPRGYALLDVFPEKDIGERTLKVGNWPPDQVRAWITKVSCRAGIGRMYLERCPVD